MAPEAILCQGRLDPDDTYPSCRPATIRPNVGGYRAVILANSLHLAVLWHVYTAASRDLAGDLGTDRRSPYSQQARQCKNRQLHYRPRERPNCAERRSGTHARQPLQRTQMGSLSQRPSRPRLAGTPIKNHSIELYESGLSAWCVTWFTLRISTHTALVQHVVGPLKSFHNLGRQLAIGDIDPWVCRSS
jgi:hypothetical protein